MIRRKAMRRRTLIFVVGGVLFLCLVALALYPHRPTPSRLAARPQPIPISISPGAGKQQAASNPKLDTELFKNPDQVALSGTTFDPDAMRVLDIVSIQISLDNYRAT